MCGYVRTFMLTINDNAVLTCVCVCASLYLYVSVLVFACQCVCVYVCQFNRQNGQLMAMVVEAESVELKVESRAQCQRNMLRRSIWAAVNGRVAVTI